MKTKNWILLILATAFTINASATKRPKMNTISLDDSKAMVIIELAEPCKSAITVESEDGNIVYFKETQKQNSKLKTIFDLSDLKTGEYTVKVKTGPVLLKREIEVNEGNILVKPLETEYDPVFAMKDNVLRISYLNFDQKDFRFQVYQDGEIIYHTEMGNDFDLQKKFDFSWLQRGDYEISLASVGKDYRYSVKR